MNVEQLCYDKILLFVCLLAAPCLTSACLCFLQSTAPAPFAQYQLAAGGGAVLKDLTWNPAYPTLLAACVSDGAVALLEVTDTVMVKSSASLPATCCKCHLERK